MSHVVTADVEITENLDVLERTAARLGGQLVRHQPTFKWWDRWYDDSPIPAGLFTPEETERIKRLSKEERQKVMDAVVGKCEHAISFPGCEYEVGIVRCQDGKLRAFWDWMDSGLQERLGIPDKNLGDGKNFFKQAYTTELALDAYQKAGYQVHEAYDEKTRTVRLELTSAY